MTTGSQTTLSAAPSQIIEECANYYDSDAADNWLDNGYDMTAWLIGLSQSQSCTVDLLVRAVISQASSIANTGGQLISDSTTQAGDRTHLRFDKEGSKRDLWIYFATPGQNLPTELAGIKVLYMTWQQRVQHIEAHMKSELAPCKEYDCVRDVRVKGAIGVVELKEPVDMRWNQPRLVELRVLIRPFGKLLYIMPPYVIEPQQLSKLTSTLLQVVTESTAR